MLYLDSLVVDRARIVRGRDGRTGWILMQAAELLLGATLDGEANHASNLLLALTGQLIPRTPIIVRPTPPFPAGNPFNRTAFSNVHIYLLPKVLTFIV